MSGKFRKEDLRILKTQNALKTALSKLLESHNFNLITVNDICEEALISRSTFYSHFEDKYDLLQRCLATLAISANSNEYTYKEMANHVNDFSNNNKGIIKNLMEDAKNETSELLGDFILSLLDIKNNKIDKKQIDSLNTIVLSTVCSGGMLNYLLWQVNNKFPRELPVMNPYIYNIILHYQRWFKNHNPPSILELTN